MSEVTQPHRQKTCYDFAKFTADLAATGRWYQMVFIDCIMKTIAYYASEIADPDQCDLDTAKHVQIVRDESTPIALVEEEAQFLREYIGDVPMYPASEFELNPPFTYLPDDLHEHFLQRNVRVICLN